MDKFEYEIQDLVQCIEKKSNTNSQLFIVNCFEVMINQVDLAAEILLHSKSTRNKNEIETIRLDFIDEIKRLEHLSLDEQENNVSEPFRRGHFCLFINNNHFYKDYANFRFGLLLTFDWFLDQKELKAIRYTFYSFSFMLNSFRHDHNGILAS